MTKPKPPWLDVYTQNDLVDRFGRETDRAAAVLASAYLDAFLEQILRLVFVKDKSIDGIFDGNGPLRSFAAKIDLTFALGLVTEATRRDMDLIRKIRNYFAHHVFDATFDSPPASQWCEAISFSGDLDLDRHLKESGAPAYSHRVRYLLGISLALSTIANSPMIPAEARSRIVGMPFNAGE